jgi:hypothetical protein
VREGSIDQADGRTRTLLRLPEGAGCASRTLAAAAASRAATPIAGAEFGAVGSRDENFPGCKALKSHEMEKKSVDWSSLPFFTARGRHRPLGYEANAVMTGLVPVIRRCMRIRRRRRAARPSEIGRKRRTWMAGT